MSEAVGFIIEKMRDDLFIPVLVDKNGYGFFRANQCVCADQAASTATRSGTRPLPFLGMKELRRGEMVDVEPDRTCNVSRTSWTWPHHGWTHGSLDRCVA